MNIIQTLQEQNIQYKQYTIINFINISYEEKKMILSWRNDEKVRKWMVHKKIILLKEHLSYINSLNEKKDKLCFLVKRDDLSLGIVELDKINDTFAYFGLNINTQIKIQGIGSILEEISIYIAKELLKLNELRLYVYKDNLKAISLYQKSRYIETSNKDNIIYMEKKL